MRIARSLIACSLVLLVSGQGPAPAGGTISGKVEVRGLSKKQTVAKPKDAWVYLQDQGKPRGRPGTGVVATITQKDYKFTPQVLVIPTGATVEFPNRDAVEHNVFSPATAKTLLWDLERYGKNVTKTRLFKVLGDFMIYCDIHKDMRATVKVVPTRFFTALTDDGTYKITNVPPGRYKVTAWSPTTNEVTSEVIEIGLGDTKTAETIKLNSILVDTEHLRKDGTPYKPGGYP